MRMSRTVLGTLLATLASSPMLAPETSSGVRVVIPATLKWEASPRAPGVLIATLVGDPTKPERYIMRAKYPANTINGPHHHPVDEEITVLSGTWYLGHGRTMDRTKAIALVPGTFVFEPAMNWHWTFTTADPVEVEIHGIGPRANIYAQ